MVRAASRRGILKCCARKWTIPAGVGDEMQQPRGGGVLGTWDILAHRKAKGGWLPSTATICSSPVSGPAQARGSWTRMADGRSTKSIQEEGAQGGGLRGEGGQATVGHGCWAVVHAGQSNRIILEGSLRRRLVYRGGSGLEGTHMPRPRPWPLDATATAGRPEAIARLPEHAGAKTTLIAPA